MTCVGIVVGIAVIVALIVWCDFHFGRRQGMEERRLRRRAVVVIVIGVCLAAFITFFLRLAEREAQMTLFETACDGNPGVQVGGPVVMRRLEFQVEHPGVEHRLHVQPTGSPDPRSGVEMRLALKDSGGAVLLERSHVFEVHRVGGRGNRRWEWQPLFAKFTPAQAGGHELELALLTVGIPKVHVRVADPLKADGRRMPGY